MIYTFYKNNNKSKSKQNKQKNKTKYYTQNIQFNTKALAQSKEKRL